MRRQHNKQPIRPPKAVRAKRLERCRSGKKSFGSLIDAKIFLARMQLKGKNERHCGYHKAPVRAYRCNFCGKYHVTSRA